MSYTAGQHDDVVIGWDKFDEAASANFVRVGQLVKRVARVGRLVKLGQELTKHF